MLRPGGEHSIGLCDSYPDNIVDENSDHGVESTGDKGVSVG